MPDDDDGAYSVTWTPDTSDTSNPSVAYSLMERMGPGRVTDDVEAGNVHWDRRKWLVNTDRAHSGVQSFYGGHTNDRNARLTSLIAVDITVDDTLRFNTWYEIEEHWDYAYVEISTDGGRRFYTIPGNITTTDNPNGSNFGNGITGDSGGWVQAVFPMGAYADSTVLLRFRYKTDSYVLEEGIYIDDMNIVQTFDSSAVLSNTITETYYDLTRPVGTYYYEVKAKDVDNQWGYWSQRKSINVTGAGVGDIAKEIGGGGFANPVYLGTTVRLAASGTAGQRLAVLDVQGRLVKTITATSTGEATWDLRDEQGRLVSPGIYFVNFGDGPKATAGKIVILK
jgi:hypothetical protein